jgi:hypothetical protein
MSCIQEILKKKGDKDFLVVAGLGLGIEGGGHYKGYDFLITFTERGHRCGYVAISSDHPLYNKKDTDDIGLEMHGGCTFFGKHSLVKRLLGQHTCEDKWIGFDAAHCDDLQDIKSAEKYFGSDNEYIHFLKTKGFIMEFRGLSKIKTKKYMENECKYIIDQLCKE